MVDIGNIALIMCWVIGMVGVFYMVYIIYRRKCGKKQE